ASQSMFSVLCHVLLLLSCLTHAEKVPVQIENGPIVGETIIADNRQLSRFLGIPYAQAPVGKLRFRRPRPLEKWNEPIETLHWPKRCVQNTKHPFNTISKGMVLNGNNSEDCLYL